MSNFIYLIERDSEDPNFYHEEVRAIVICSENMTSAMEEWCYAFGGDTDYADITQLGIADDNCKPGVKLIKSIY